MKTISELQNAKLRGALESVKVEVARIAGSAARLIIYGSYARGEEREDSDVDLMVVLPDDIATTDLDNSVRNAIYDIGFDNDFVLSVMIVTESQVSRNKGFMVFGNVEKEGVPI